MDPLDVITNIESISPHYGAIFSADEQSVIGYEVVGKIVVDGTEESLGAFLQDESVPDEYRLEVEDKIARKALNYLPNAAPSVFIFLHRDVNLLMSDQGERFLSLLKEFEKQGCSLDRIVLDIKADKYHGDMKSLVHLLTYYRTYGIKVSIHHSGGESSNLNRIGLLSPDILKIDLKPLTLTSVSQSYNDVLYSIVLLARKIGADLLYKDIEMNFQLRYAWKNGGRYFQGAYLQNPAEHSVDKYLLKGRLKTEFHQFIVTEKKKLEMLYQKTEAFHLRVHGHLSSLKKETKDFNTLLIQLAEQMSDCSFRMYVCDEDGFQQTGNIYRDNNNWIIQEEYYEKNWSWRPYFLENMLRMRRDRKGFFSDLYTDIETGDTIRTFSYPIDEQLYLFIDLPYSYLYEQDGLL
ncbi:EAL domain-containing protein [Bacillus lacus]|uniref:EAL domain-containing protein n=1 Tax=Metabacillus lacus TaxID=1983721 RepID=A0A7X2J286_9BACI|nr:EAL-associated domain-containing protein [Metabacillus lacus]MRX73782.1 EAL domain-containing protein [Metabacillus lacus]